ncbi:predicted protein [Nematostella vectensis]|uniref:G-protein coupled receptors family 1 profile domain-containing protein n=1 Tax=Nematostella vectensis TaxID=45351 RepID=A7SRU8_NEMVE|nr:predicted protein [Nematostella vectensis]|eukprot:XP_001625694.1 predicted protein [Nematostella vectensis]
MATSSFGVPHDFLTNFVEKSCGHKWKSITNDTLTDEVIYGVFGAITSVGVVGNALILVVLFKNPSLRSTTLSLLGNLAMADLVGLLFAPTLALDYGPGRERCVHVFPSSEVHLVFRILILAVTIPVRYIRIVKDIFFSNAAAPMNVPVLEEAKKKQRVVGLVITMTVSFALSFLPTLVNICINHFYKGVIPKNASGTLKFAFHF